MKSLLIFLTLFFSITTMAETQYFFGDSKFLTPDKKTALGESPYLVKRILDKKKKSITEIVITLSRTPGQVYDEHKATMFQSKDPNKFKVQDKKNLFNGYVKFEGKEWEWKKWSYAIAFKNGDKLVGEGTLSAKEMKTEKMIMSAKKVPKVLIVDTLKVVSEVQYNKHLKDFVTGKIIQSAK